MIHANQKAAKESCETYVKKLIELQEEFGVNEECEDSCCAVYITTKYFDESGNVQTYHHD